jgi:hypothetical protein
MPQHSKHASKNMGYGRDPKYAAKNKLRDHFNSGHHATTITHSERFNLFIDWIEEHHKINDLWDITNSHFLAYSEHIKTLMNDERISVSTAHNRISSCNVVLKIMRGDNHIRIDKIAKTLGKKRCYIRNQAPDGIDLNEILSIQHQLKNSGNIRLAAILGLARTLGMRLREAVLCDLQRIKREAKKFGLINIQEGTKGGRRGAHAPRWIDIKQSAADAIDFATLASPPNSRNLLNPNETYISFIRAVVRHKGKNLGGYGIRKIHDLRAAYACERYEQITGHPAPVIAKRQAMSKAELRMDKEARRIISRELGHERIEICNSYIGSCKR